MNHKYTFLFQSADEDLRSHGFPVAKSVAHDFLIDRDVSWHDAVREFESFLSSIYGYRIELLEQSEDHDIWS